MKSTVKILAMALMAMLLTGCGKTETAVENNVETETGITEAEDISDIEEENDTLSQTELPVEQETEVSLSEQETENLEMLIGLFSIDSYLFTEDMENYSFPVNDLDTAMQVVELTSCFYLNDDSYEAYLPPMEVDRSILTRYFETDAMQEYLNNVFGIVNADLSAYCEEGRVVCNLYGELVEKEVNIEKAILKPDDTYKITGTVVIIEPTATPSEPYAFDLTIKPNSESLFGYQVVSMNYSGAVSDETSVAEGENSLQDILLNPDGHKEYYPQEIEYQNLYFALVDIDSDGQDEIFLANAEDVHPNFGPEGLTIFNILKYDNGIVTDIDGDKIYVPLAVSNSFHFYDTGILMTMADASNGYTNFWNLLTGEYTEGWLSDPDTRESKKILKEDGTELTGAEAETYFDSLCSGNEIPFVWYDMTPENVAAYLSGGEMEPAYVKEPYGTYKATNGASLEFSSTGSVCISEGNSHTWCTYTVDASGKLTISTESETIEGTYNAQDDFVVIYAAKFRKY